MDKRTINLDLELKDLDGKIFRRVEGSEETDTVGRQIAKALAYADNSPDALKFMAWALTLNNKESLELDESDFTVLRDWIKSSKLPPIIKAPALRAMNAVELCAPDKSEEQQT